MLQTITRWNNKALHLVTKPMMLHVQPLLTGMQKDIISSVSSLIKIPQWLRVVKTTYFASTITPVVSLSSRWTRCSVLIFPDLSIFLANGSSNFPILWCTPGPPGQPREGDNIKHTSNHFHPQTIYNTLHRHMTTLNRRPRWKLKFNRNFLQYFLAFTPSHVTCSSHSIHKRLVLHFTNCALNSVRLKTRIWWQTYWEINSSMNAWLDEFLFVYKTMSSPCN